MRARTWIVAVALFSSMAETPPPPPPDCPGFGSDENPADEPLAPMICCGPPGHSALPSATAWPSNKLAAAAAAVAWLQSGQYAELVQGICGRESQHRVRR